MWRLGPSNVHGIGMFATAHLVPPVVLGPAFRKRRSHQIGIFELDWAQAPTVQYLNHSSDGGNVRLDLCGSGEQVAGSIRLLHSLTKDCCTDR